MLRKRCPHTGIINLFADDEPAIAVASVTRAPAVRHGRPVQYLWRCYVDGVSSGVSSDLRTAERRIAKCLASAAHIAAQDGELAAVATAA